MRFFNLQKSLVRFILVGAFFVSFVSEASSLHCNRHNSLFGGFSNYFFREIGNPKELYEAISGEAGNYGYTQDFRVLQYDKNSSCSDYCYTVILADPLPYYHARRLTITPAKDFSRGVYRMNTEYRSKPHAPWQQGWVLTCLAPDELKQE